MFRTFFYLCYAVVLLPLILSAQDAVPYCATTGPSSPEELQSVQQLVNTTIQIAVILVDFSDSRKPDGSLPTIDADTAYFSGDAINTVGSMGWVKINPMDPNSPLRKKIRKYTYEDYWNQMFSIGTYYGDSVNHPHPDFNSHGIKVYGSMSDYYEEVSYNNFHVVPAPTRSGSQDMYHSGIVNRIDTANGKNFVRWIKLPDPKSYYAYPGSSLINDAISRINELHSLPSSDPEYLEFNTSGFVGKYAIVGAGSNIGGWTYLNHYAYSVSEKYYYVPNADPNSTFDGIIGHMHEFAHTLGLPHVMRGSFEPMHWGGLAPLFNYCPPHFNPLTKIQFGWLPEANILKVKSNTSVSLRPSHLPPSGTQPTTALVTVYGEAGKNNDYSHSEYFMVEYRTRVGFNRFTGGSQLPPSSQFTGGALIWHYSSVTPFPYNSGDDIRKYLSIKVPEYGPNYGRGRDQAPTDYFTLGTSFDSVSQTPNSNSVIGLKTGIAMNNFNMTGGNLNFNLTYQLGAPPNYSIIYKIGNTPTALSGNVFVQYGISGLRTISPGSKLDFIRGVGVSISNQKFLAIGGSGSNDSIFFKGAGYGNYRFTWGGENIFQTPSSVGILYRPYSTPDTVRFQNCIIKDAGVGLYMNLTNYSTSSWIRPVVEGNRFKNTSIDIALQGKTTDVSPIPDIAGYDNNTFSSFLLFGKTVLSGSSQFSVPANATLRFEQSIVPTFSRLEILSGNTLLVNGQFQTLGSLNLKGGNIIFNQGGTIQTGSILKIENGTNITIGNDINVQSGAILNIDRDNIIHVGTGNTLAVNGKLVAKGNQSNRIIFTSSNQSPSPGDWGGIVFSGGGPDTLSYCTIKYANTGLRFFNTSPPRL
ncbi:MAG: hypothetical protein QME58_13060 [Bacteroidota bacterium]|nr:hypothetical protein [Bacteroidota bacterium]